MTKLIEELLNDKTARDSAEKIVLEETVALPWFGA